MPDGITPVDLTGIVFKGAGLSNVNTVGMEIIAKDDRDVAPAQVEAAKAFIARNYPTTPVYGHGEVNPGHKQATEGLTVANAIRAMRQAAPSAPSAASDRLGQARANLMRRGG